MMGVTGGGGSATGEFSPMEYVTSVTGSRDGEIIVQAVSLGQGKWKLIRPDGSFRVVEVSPESRKVIAEASRYWRHVLRKLAKSPCP